MSSLIYNGPRGSFSHKCAAVWAEIEDELKNRQNKISNDDLSKLGGNLLQPWPPNPSNTAPQNSLVGRTKHIEKTEYEKFYLDIQRNNKFFS